MEDEVRKTTPSGCSLGFVTGMGKGLTPAKLEVIEGRPVGYPEYVTALMCTTSRYHNDEVTEKTLEDGGWERISEYPSNYAHPGMVVIWLKKLPNGMAIPKLGEDRW